MFGMSFTEILIVAVVAILFLGPDKLPNAMMQIAKFLKTFKKTVNEAKSSIEQEIHIEELKKEAQDYKQSFEKSKEDFTKKLSLEDFGNESSKKTNENIKSLEKNQKKESQKKPKKAKEIKKSEEA